MSDQCKFWIDCWNTDYLFWHVVEVHPALTRHAERFLGSSTKRVFVPLCGKSLDMKWMGDRGHTVIGCDISDLGIKSFFEETNTKYSVKDMVSIPDGKVFISDDKKYMLYCCDMLAMDPKQEQDFGTIDAVYDRGALEALDKDLRQKYMSLMCSLLEPHTVYLLEVPIRDPSSTNAPYYVGTDELENSFDRKALVEEIDRIELKDIPYINHANVPKGVEGFFVYFITFP